MQDIRQINSVREFLLDISVYDRLERVAQERQLPVGRIDEFLDLTNAFLKKQITLGQIPQMISQAFGVDKARAVSISADICGYALLPLANYLPEIEGQIKEWGGKIEDYPKKRVKKEEVTPEVIVRAFAQDIELQLPEHLMKRFIYLVGGFIAGERDGEATKTLLMRPINIGGLDFKDEMVGKLFEQLKTAGLMKEKEVKGEKEKEEVKGVKEREKKEGEGPGVKIDYVKKQEKEMLRLRKESVEVLKSEKEDKEPVKKSKKLPKKISASSDSKKKRLPVKSTPHALATSIPVINGPERPLIDVFRRKKISKKDREGIVGAHKRGIRELHQTEGLLKDRYNLKGKDLEVVIGVLKGLRGESIQYPVSSSQDQKEKGGSKPGDIHEKEKELLNERHAAMTKKVSNQDIDPIMPQARVSAARSKGEELELQSKKVPKEKVIAAQAASKPKKAKAKISAQSVLPQKKAEQKKVEDIKRVRTLVGPVDEIGTLTLGQFRRFSSDPNEATEKILNKLELLESTSYEDRIRGVKAWRKSPVNILYLNMAREALEQGISIAEAAAARRNAGKESLSPSEIQAVVDLNRKMKF